MRGSLEHPAWLTALGTAAAYGLVLLIAFFVLFFLPYVAFVTFGG